MSTVPSGCISKAQENLRLTLADSATFRTLVGADTQAKALARIFHEALPPPVTGPELTLEEMQSLRPYALICTAPESGFDFTTDAMGTSYSYYDSGVLLLRIEQDIPEEITTDHAEVMMRFLNVIGGILDDWRALSGTGGYLAINKVTLESGPFRTHKDEVKMYGDSQWVNLRITWGLRG